jgi:hypothetical protein
MPIKKVDGTSLHYYLIAFDRDGNERDKAKEKIKMSQKVVNVLSSESITDVFIFSHGLIVKDYHLKYKLLLSSKKATVLRNA